jgi:tRNA (guanine37-N1)-methyltransferase
MSPDLRAELGKILCSDLVDQVTRSYDIYGSKTKAVAVIEISEDLRNIEEDIANALMRVNRNVSGVLVKESARTGEFRTRSLRLLAGDPDTEVLHKESGCIFRLDPATVYFSPRESKERDRITKIVQENENILVMFSGIGPIPIRIAKVHRRVNLTSIELNPIAHNYCVENIHLNKVSNQIKVIQGDVRKICPQFKKLFNRIIMPLPKGAYKFLDVAIPILKNEGTIHLYHWATKETAFSEAESIINKVAENFNREVEFTGHVKVSQYSPGTWKVRIDARISSSSFN